MLGIRYRLFIEAALGTACYVLVVRYLAHRISRWVSTTACWVRNIEFSVLDIVRWAQVILC